MSKDKNQKNSKKERVSIGSGNAMKRFQENTGIRFGIKMKVLSVILLLTILPMLTIFIAADLGITNIRDLSVDEAENELTKLAEGNLKAMASEKSELVNMDFKLIENTIIIFSQLAEHAWNNPALYKQDLSWYYHNATTALNSGMPFFDSINMSADDYTSVQLANVSFGNKANAYYFEDSSGNITGAGDAAVIIPADITTHAYNDANISSNLEQFMVNTRKNNPNIYFIYLGTESGVFRNAPFNHGDIWYNPTQRGWYRDAVLAGGEIIWTEPYMDANLPLTPMITCARAIYNETGGLIGVVSIDVAIRTIQENIIDTDIGYGGSGAMLITLDGITIAHKNFNNHSAMASVDVGDDIPAINITEFESITDFDYFYGKYMAESSGIFIDGQNADSNGRYISFAKVESVNYVVVFTVDVEAVVAPAVSTGEKIGEEGNRVSQSLYSIFIMTIIIAIVLGYYVSWKIVEPIQRLTKSAERVRSGQLDESIIVDSDDEIGLLARSFEKMVAAIKLSNIMAAKDAGVKECASQGKQLTVDDELGDEEELCPACANKLEGNEKICKICGEDTGLTG